MQKSDDFLNFVPDGDAVYQRAIAAGATSVTEITSMFWGDRGGRVRDPFGNIWWIQTHVENVAPEEMAKRASEQKYLDAMQYAQESFDHDMKRRVREAERASAWRELTNGNA